MTTRSATDSTVTMPPSVTETQSTFTVDIQASTQPARPGPPMLTARPRATLTASELAYLLDNPSPTNAPPEVARDGQTDPGVLRRRNPPPSQLGYALALPDVPETEVCKRFVPQPKLRMQFETLNQMNLRLSQTMVMIGNNLYYIIEIIPYEESYILVVQGWDQSVYKIDYSSPLLDLRVLEPQYLVLSGTPMFATRLARRQQRQGLDSHNVGVKSVGETTFSQFRTIWPFMEGFRYREPLGWNSALYDLMVKARVMKAVRLNAKVAVGRQKNTVFAEYKGRFLGLLNENCVAVDEDDLNCRWLKKDVSAVGLDLIAKRD